MDDIIATVPWSCGDRDCPVGWHLANYWIQSDGTYTVDHYADGDHDEIEADDVPGYAEQETAWLEYWRHVLATGDDPLCQVNGEHVVERRAWQVVVGNSIIGPVLRKARPATRDRTAASGFHGRGGWFYGDEIPEDVARFLLFDHKDSHDRYWRVEEEYRNTVDNMTGMQRYTDLVADAHDTTDPKPATRGTGVQFFVTVERRYTSPPSATKIRKVARRAVRDHQKTLDSLRGQN